ncbi:MULTISPECIES: RHS repeat-associated core domain-containing protein [Pseudomonas]|uniref:RHS repeat-associated core domain-containing protein n=1 Tax=Pseudomonas TaxID=286 RepID=UPI0011A7704D|nr:MULTISPECIES: RHS repeat-associated core domain-containing protein [Pseudomonas]MBI6923864.1 RHS repeat-associated core domain-containing protein [Pseudomonas putida]
MISSRLLGSTDTSAKMPYLVEAVRWSAFSPYGHSTLSNGHRLAYAGERFIESLSGYFFGNGYRIYSPVLGRFYGPDNLCPFRAGGCNAYAAFAGDPVNNVDPTGHYSMAVIKAVARFRLGAMDKKINKHLPTLTDAYPEDRVAALRRYKAKEDVRASDFRVISRRKDLGALQGVERKFVLTNTGELITGNQEIDSFPHPMLTYFTGRESGVVSAGYVAVRKGVVVFSSTTGHYCSSMLGKDTLTPVVNHFNNMGVIARQVRGGGNSDIPMDYDPWIDIFS